MSEIVNVTNQVTEVVIIRQGEELGDVIQITSDRETVVRVVETGPQGPQGEQGPQGDPGTPGIAALIDDPNPTLGADLIMNGFQFKGQAETTDLIIDGGLL